LSESVSQTLPESRMDVDELLQRTRVEVAPETYFLIGLQHQEWARLLENPELSPRGSAPHAFA
jgi:hypothetical protein